MARHLGVKPGAPAFALVQVGLLAGCNGDTDSSSNPSETSDPTEQPFAFLDAEPPPMGPLTVVRVGDESPARQLLATTLQGVVNRTTVRIYIVPDGGEPEPNTDSESARYWLDVYADEYGVAITAEVDLDEALASFAREATGYVLASEGEPWTIPAATTLAGLEGALVSTEDTVDALDALGLDAIDDLRGRWSDSSEATRDSFARWYSDSAAGVLAVLAPEQHTLRDFLIQNRIFTVYGRPADDGWDALLEQLDAVPPNTLVLGYLSTNGAEELAAVSALSERGLVLVPSDTSRNLSVHRSIPVAEPIVASPRPEPSCPTDALLVAVALSDGDNLALPLDVYARTTYWLSEDRGSLPLGWSFSPALASFAPAVAAHYLEGMAPADEPVAMIGVGYAYPTRIPDPSPFWSATFAAMSRTGMKTLWEIDPWMGDPTDDAWSSLDDAREDGVLSGFLLGYQGSPSEPWVTPTGLPVASPSSAYDDTPTDLAVKLNEAVTAWRAGGGPSRVFVSAPVWTNDVPGLVEALEPIAAQPDVRFVAPAELLACIARELW